MKKENDISFFDFLDFKTFVLPKEKSALLELKNIPEGRILVVYFNKKNNPELEILLKNILSAAKLNFEKDVVALKTTAEEKFSFTEIQKKIKVKDLLFFGIPPSNFGLNYAIKPYELLTVNERRILFTNSLEAINADVNKKKNLWNCLKEMYL